MEHIGEHYIDEKTVHKMFESPTLKSAALRIQLTPRDAVGVLRKLDPANEGAVPTDAFVEGCVRLEGSAEGEDVYLLKVVARQLEMELVEMSVLLVELVEEVETMLMQLSRLSDVVAGRKAVALNALRIEKTRFVPESVKKLQEIRDKAAQSASAVRDIEHVPVGGVQVNEDEVNHAFSDQTPRTIERMKLTPRACWNFLQWGSAGHRVNQAKTDIALDEEIHALMKQVQALEKELQKRDMRSGLTPKKLQSVAAKKK